MTPSWYDVLDVDEDATPAEIRRAWKTAIADLDPGDRRFRLANQAAEVLLDPERRAAHDAELAAAEPVDETEDDRGRTEDDVEHDAADDDARRRTTPPTTPRTTSRTTTRSRTAVRPPGGSASWALSGLGSSCSRRWPSCSWWSR